MSHKVFATRKRNDFGYRESVERQKERDREHKKQAVWGVFQHSSGAEGGYVAREGWTKDDGEYGFSSPYSQQTPIHVYKRQHDAEKHAERLTYGKER